MLCNSPATWRLLRILVIVQLVPTVWAILFNPPVNPVYQTHVILGLNTDHFLRGAIWQPLTYALIHGNWLHLFTNCLGILLFGAKLEQYLTRSNYWFVILLAVLGGSVSFLCFDLFTHSIEIPQTIVGSSAVCFALLLLMTTLSPDSRFLPFFTGRLLGLAAIASSLILALLNPNLPTGFLAELGSSLETAISADLFKISHACHFGGALVGLIYGKWLLRPRISLAKLRKARKKRELIEQRNAGLLRKR